MHVALVQEVSAVRHELGRTTHSLAAAQEEGGLHLREEGAAPAVGKRWRFATTNPAVAASGERSIQRYLLQLHACLDKDNPWPIIPLSHDNLSSSACFRTAPEAEEAIAAAVRSDEYNGYTSPATSLPARRAVEEYLSCDLPYELCTDDIFLTSGCPKQSRLLCLFLAN
ncbi:hypothetical protein E2562_002919 [Oryza meyeriana var. granulata]|uniref:Aminotransferase class I/classII domain-containing protein n=1 Tax=Oryza meyeriana var. granulata TaxID=110450 RepID=A0A6G1DCV5_9ORYZ|nr:hypothetical protein E2562_002919 [Oryza meyeriana var. granulata]